MTEALRTAIVEALEALDADEDRCGCRQCDADAIMEVLAGAPLTIADPDAPLP